MNLGRSNGRWTGGHDIPDVLLEELLAGRYEGGSPDLVAVSLFLARLRSLADRAAPPPSAALAEILGGPAGAGRPDLPGEGEPAAPQIPLRYLRRRSIRLGAVAAAAAVLLLAAVAAGSARLLPSAAQHVAGRVVRIMTPFELPEDGAREPGPPSGSAAGPGAPGDRRRPAPGDPPPPGAERSPGDPPGPVGGGGNQDPRPRTGEAPPVPTTTPAPPPGPAVSGPVPPPPPGTAPVRPPPPEPSRFRADLTGAFTPLPIGDPDGHGTAVLDVNPARRELCLTLVLSGLAPVVSTHLHAAPLHPDGPVVAAFTGPALATSTQCVAVASELIAGIQAAPEAYYLDVHSLEFPSGALRGQLHR